MMLSSLIAHEESRQDLKAGLIIVDTFSQCTAGMDENSSGEVALYIAACAEFTAKHGVTILNVHHNNRSGKYRGSGALFANSDFVLIAKRNDKGDMSTTISIDKHKDASTEHKFTMSLKKHDLGLFDEFGEAVDTLSLSRPENNIYCKKNEGVTETVLSKSKINEEWLQVELQKISNEKVLQSTLIESYMKCFNQNKEASKQAVYRAVTKLSANGKIRTDSEGKTKLISLVIS